MNRTTPQSSGASHTTIGITDLMTSLAIVFILLFAAQITKTSSAAQSELRENKEDVQTALRDHIQRLGLSLDADPRDPLALVIVVPEDRLTFEFGKSALSPTADQFLEDVLPFYVEALCGPLRNKIDSLAIEGHTDDQGSDVYNLKLSQERSLAVMVKGLQVIQATEPSCVPVLSSDHLSDRARQTRLDLRLNGHGKPRKKPPGDLQDSPPLFRATASHRTINQPPLTGC